MKTILNVVIATLIYRLAGGRATLQQAIRDVRRLVVLNKVIGVSLFIFALYFATQSFWLAKERL